MCFTALGLFSLGLQVMKYHVRAFILNEQSIIFIIHSDTGSCVLNFNLYK